MSRSILRLLPIFVALATARLAVAGDELADWTIDNLSRVIVVPQEIKALASQARAAVDKRDWPKAIELHERLHLEAFEKLPPGNFAVESRWKHRAGIGRLRLLKMDVAGAQADFQKVLTAFPKAEKYSPGSARAAAIGGMRRAAEMLGRFGDALNWQTMGDAEGASWCGNCQQSRQFYSYPERETLKAALARSPIEALTSLRAGGLQPSASILTSSAHAGQRTYARRYAAFIIGEIHYRNGDHEKARKAFDELLTYDLSENETLETFVRTYVDRLDSAKTGRS